MTKRVLLTSILLIALLHSLPAIDAWIRINQLGYYPEGLKKAVFISTTDIKLTKFTIHDVLTNEQLAELYTVYPTGQFEQFLSTYTLDFSSFTTVGAFYIKVDHYYSPNIYINNNVYNGTADFLLNFMRAQRCGYNPFLQTNCHQNDGIEVYGNELKQSTYNIPIINTKPNSKKQAIVPDPILPTIKMVDVKGGWHDAATNIKYASTIATATFQMLYAYRTNPSVFKDNFDDFGKKTPNGIPDILDEAKWGLDWLIRMNPENEVIYHQVGDDRDLTKTNLPGLDSTDYSWGAGKERPVYMATNKPQGLFNISNQSTGIASIAGKFASAFALGSYLLTDHYAGYAKSLEKKAIDVYEFGKKYKGVCQATPANSPLFYQEDNWVDDMELAATQLYQLIYEVKYLNEATGFGKMEPVSPWIFTDSVKHYQWYPFINYGHFMLARSENPKVNSDFKQNILANLNRANIKSKNNPFMIGSPMIWRSNNYISALATQYVLYRKQSNDNRFIESETALVDWLFGCNPWGTSMILGLPENGKFPIKPHSNLNKTTDKKLIGGLISGPVNNSIIKYIIPGFNSNSGNYGPFQTKWAVYQDDSFDFLTNEPTIDGTASLMYLLSTKQLEAKEEAQLDLNKYEYGAVTRTNPTNKQLSLAFTGHEYNDGIKTIIKALNQQKIKASFFFTGDFLRNKKNKKTIETLIKEGHYVGPHSNKNIVYNSKRQRDTLLVTKAMFMDDLRENYMELAKFGINKLDAPFFVPPQFWYNDSISIWSKDLGITLINYTPGTNSWSDDTTPNMRDNYFSSNEIYSKIIQLEKKEGLNGQILLFNVGSDKQRTDKFYPKLNGLLFDILNAGYKFVDLYDATKLHTKKPVVEKKKRKN